MSRFPLYPLQFDPLYHYRLWGGRRFDSLLAPPLSGDSPIGEAWVLSDREDHASIVSNGPLKGLTIGQLLERYPEEMLGSTAGFIHRFPLLLKILDAREMLSVQVHPSDAHADLLPAGESGKTEAWVVVDAGPESRICAGLKPGTTTDNLRRNCANGAVPDSLACFTPKSGDCVLVPAGMVHSLGGDVVVFEVQQNSDVTFRLYDWNRIDVTTGRPRELQVDKAMACIDFSQTAAGPVIPVVEEVVPALRERVILCKHFGVWRISGDSPFAVGAAGMPRALVCIAGKGQLVYDDSNYDVGKGTVLFLPAVVGVCGFKPLRSTTLLEISLPEEIAP
jgi:mannose-6-phosphate isomerase